MMESRSLFWHHHKQVARSRSLLAALMLVWGAASHALPTGPQIVNGTAAFIQTPNLLTINNSNNAILNWQQFNIGASEAVRFNQPSANSSVLNRVLGSDPSAIYGQLSSNGRVWLINPAGILVGPNARIDTAGFVASTLNLRNEDFLAGRLTFGGNSNASSVVNQGSITTPDGGSVYLIAPTVSNEGLITTPKGETILAAGQTVRLIDTATPGVNVEVTGSEGNATNLGSIIAEAGRIGVAGVLVRNSGTLNASSVVSQGGRIFLKARQDTYVDQSARIDSTGTKGGNIEVLGNRVAVTDRAQLDASGQNGGGSVLVGGDYQGKNPAIQNSYITYFGPQASLKVDAITSGDGGKVIVWADDTTRAYGSISARGGNKGGNGGTVETSGHWLDAAGIRVNAGSPRGKAGDWLIDPFNIDIQAGSDANISTSAGTFSDSTAGAVLTPTTIQNTMYGSTGADGTNVTVQASGNIVVTSPIATTNTVSRQLKLAAGGSITINNSINLANSSTLLLNAGTFISQSSPGIITATNLGIRALGDVSLNTAPNAVGNLAANIGDSSNQNHNIRFKNNLALNIGSGIDSLSGISISLDSSGFDSTSQNGVIALTSDTGNLAQSAGALLAGKAVVISAKNVSLTESNSTGVIAGNATDASPTFSYKSANAIALSNIAMTNIDTKNGITFTNGSGLVVLDNSGASTAKNIGQSTGAIIGDSTHTASLVLKSKGAAQLSLDNNITNLAATVGSGLSAGSDGMYVKSVQALTVNTSPLDNVTGINANSTSANFGSTVSLTVSNAGGVAPLVTAGKLALGSPSISLTGYSSYPAVQAVDGVTLLTDSLTTTNVAARTTNSVSGIIHMAPYTSGKSVLLGASGCPDTTDGCLTLSPSVITSTSTFDAPVIAIGNNQTAWPFDPGNYTRPTTDSIHFADALTLTGRNLLLAARGGISQTSSGVITASKLGISIDNVTGLTPALTSVDLSTANNSVGTLAAKLNTANESFKFSNVGAMTIRDSSVYYTTGSGSVMYSMNGLSTQGAIELTAGGALAISQPITSTVGNISLATSAGITSTYSGTAISANGTGTVDLIAGWTSGTAISAHTFTTGNGKDISLTNSRIYSGGTMTLNAGNNVEVNATAAAAGFESAGSQTINAKGIITLTAGTSGHDQKAYVKASGTQTIAADKISLSGGGASGPNSYNNYATIFQDSTSAVSQSFTLSGTGTVLTLQAGSGSGSGDTTNSYGCATGCSSNFATISNYGSSGQSFSFTGATPSISLTGGTIGVRNFAGIFNVSSGSQTIGSSSNRPAITLTGGSSGGSDAGGTDYSGFGFKAGNGTLIVSGKAELTAGSDVAVNQSSTVPGTQTIYASQITLEGTPQTGTSTGISGAGLFAASSQTINVTGGTLALKAGISSGQSRTRIWSMGGTQTIEASTLSVAGASNTATTGDNRAAINAWGTGQQMTLASALTLTGGTGSNNTSAANVLQTGSGAQTITMTGSGAQISLTGPYVALGTENSTSSSQTITFSGSGSRTITVTGANASTPYTANSGYESSIGSAGAQTITGATSITLNGGGTSVAVIHDAAATIRATGTQTISSESITLTGGGTSGSTSYNNYASIYHGGSTGSQTITMSGGSASLSLTGGSGTGTGGSYPSACVVCVSTPQSSHNVAEIVNKGGTQTINFLASGSISLTGGTLGKYNYASINNTVSTLQKIGSTNGSSYYPSISLTGGASGGAWSSDHVGLRNNAEISTGDSGSQTIQASSIVLSGGGDSGTVGGAIIGGGTSQNITTTGNVTLTGGYSNVATPGETYNVATPAGIGAKSNISMTLNIGGNLSLTGGTSPANSSPAIIGSLSGTATGTVTVTGTKTVTSNASATLTGSTALINVTAPAPTAPSLADCTTTPTLSGCTSVLPSLSTCTTTPTEAGCTAVLPALSVCTTTPAAAGCSAVLPALSTCTTNPTTAGCSAVLPPLSTCTATPTAAGCSAVLPPLATCTTTPTAAGCSAVLPPLATCTTTPTAAGCSAVLPPLDTCTTNPSTAGCSAVLPPLTTCTTTPTAPGCSAVLPPLATCTTTPTAAGCSAVLPPLSTCTTTPTAAGCSAVLPPLATCTTTPTAAGCSAVLPPLTTCTTTPTAPGCSAVLPPLDTCTTSPTTAGCAAVLPPLTACTTTPTAPGCSAVLPPLATCTTTPTAAGCSAVLPPLTTCTTTPTAPGCSAVLPPLATCTTTPTAAGCSAVLPPLSTCTTTPTAAGCSAVLPPLTTCTTTPTAAGCSAVLPTISTCTTSPTAAGCSAVLPPLSTCTTTPTAAGCSAVLPPIATCATTPTAAGCSAVLPTIDACTTNPTSVGCSAVLPPLATCTTTPSAAGCAAVLPPIATCTTTPTAAGCSAVLPTLNTCTTTPSAAGCSAVLPPISNCTTNPTLAGCSAVLPSVASCSTDPNLAGCVAVIPPAAPVAQAAVAKEVIAVTTTVSKPASEAVAAPPAPPPPAPIVTTTGTTSLAMLKTNQTIGGSEGTFGGTSTPVIATPQVTTSIGTPSLSPSAASSSSGFGSSSSSGGASSTGNTASTTSVARANTGSSTSTTASAASGSSSGSETSTSTGSSSSSSSSTSSGSSGSSSEADKPAESKPAEKSAASDEKKEEKKEEKKDDKKEEKKEDSAKKADDKPATKKPAVCS